MKNTVCANDITTHGKALFGFTVAVITTFTPFFFAS